MILAAVLTGVLMMVVLYLLINAGGWYRDTRRISQAMNRAARDGTTALSLPGSLPLQPASAYTLPPTADTRQCLDIAAAKETTRTALARNLALYESRFVTVDGHPLTAAEIAADTTGTYLKLAAGNPAGMGCATMGNTHPGGLTYNHPWVYVRLHIPVKSLFSNFVIHWQTETTATNAVTKQGG